MKIEQAPHTFFESKEEYLHFRQAWKTFYKDDKQKKKEHKDYYGGIHRKSDLTCEHHLIYALLRGRDITKSFTPNRRGHGQEPYGAYRRARGQIVFAVNMLVNHGNGKAMSRLLLPFGGLVTSDMLATALKLSEEWRFADE